MKKIYILLIILLLVSACSSTEASREERFTVNDKALYITTDKETGCKYLLFDWNRVGGITPLLKSDGTPDCN